MLKRLTRKLFVLFVLVAALAAVSSTPAAPTNRGGVFCLDAPLDSGCYGLICCNEWGGCYCHP